jgi:hypothetical protein
MNAPESAVNARSNQPRRWCRAGAAAGVLLLIALAFHAARFPAPLRAASGPERPWLLLEILDAATGKPTPARFELRVNEVPYHPLEVGSNGLRFISLHDARKQILTVTYARGTGPVEIELPDKASRIEVRAVKGFEYRTASETAAVSTSPTKIKLTLQRWTNLLDQGWAAADAHVHYDRLNRRDNRDWFTMMDADGLAHLHFMMVKGGKVPGEWGLQYSYGRKGEAGDGRHLLTAGEEYRDTFQGHINLLGLNEIIQPIMAGTGGVPHYPPLHDVLRRARELGGLPGAAHGGSLSREPTVIVDAVLGALDFVEIANTHLYSLENWYRLMNCGYHLPPAAGTDLPNYPARDSWQPFLGGMRMYVQAGRARDFEAWKEAVKAGRVFVTSGPLLAFKVNGRGPGDTVRLPAAGGELEIEAEAATPVDLRDLQLVQNGRVVPARVEKHELNGAHRWRLHHRLRVDQSCWLAVRCEGAPIQALQQVVLAPVPWHKREAIAHTAAIRVLVGEQPIRSREDAAILIERLRRQKEFYRTEGTYAEEAHRQAVMKLFDRAVAELER